MTVFNLKYTEIVVADYNFVHQVFVKVADGNFTYSEKINRDYLMDRGLLDQVTVGDDVPLDISFDFRWEWLTGLGGNITIEDALKHRGNAAGWTTGDNNPCQPYCVNLQVIFTPPCVSEYEEITFPQFRYEELSHDSKARSISCKGRCNVTEPTVLHST